MSGSLRSSAGRLLPDSWRPHVLDALDERGVALGSRVVIERPGEATLTGFTEAYPSGGELLVQTLWSAVSRGTEGAIFRGETAWATYPAVPGYSQVGVVLAASGAAGPQKGELVASTGKHASVARCLVEEAIRVPDGVDPAQAALHNLAAIAFQSVRRLRLRGSERIIVLGAGVLGHLAARFARAGGHDVTLVNRSAPRLEATAGTGIRKFCLEEAGAGEWPTAPVVIDFTGAPEGAVEAARMTEPGGTVVLAGSTRGELRDPPVGEWAHKRIGFLGAHIQSLPGGADPDVWSLQRERQAFIGMLAAGQLDVAALLTDVVAPGDLPRVYGGAVLTPSSVGVVVDWSRIAPPAIERPSPARPLGKASRLLTAKPTVKQHHAPRRADRRRVRFAVVGCGDIGIRNAKAIEESGAGIVTLAVDPNESLAESLARGSGAAVAPALGEGLAEAEVDAVLICAPHHLHHDLAIEAAEAGKHVVVEKPLALDAYEGAAMISACERAGVRLSVAYVIGLSPSLRRACALIEQGAIGQVTAIDARWAEPRDEGYWSGGFSGRAKADWRSRRATAGGGVLIMNASHILFAMNRLAGGPAVAAAATKRTLLHQVEVEDTVGVELDYEGGAVGTLLATSAIGGPSATELRVFGTRGQLQVIPSFAAWGEAAGAAAPYESRRAAAWLVPERTAYFRGVADALLDDSEMPVSPDDALAVQRAIDMSYED